MRRNLEDLAREAMELAPEARSALAKRLLDSLGDVDPGERERLWLEESARRYADVRTGAAGSVSSDELFAQLANR